MLDFKGLFSDYISEDTAAAFAGAEVGNCNLDSENRALSAVFYCSDYIDSKTRDKFSKQISDSLKLNSVQAGYNFERSALCSEAIADIIERLRYKNVTLNGYFNKAVYTVNDDSIDICLKYGGGGHKNAGTCQLDNDKVDELLPDILQYFNS